LDKRKNENLVLQSAFTKDLIEAGCDEAGRGCLAGPVFAAAVILPKKFSHPLLNDSKKLTPQQRYHLREIIQKNAIEWSVAQVDNQTIDEINILQASISSMHLALDKLNTKPELLLIDGNKFNPYKNIAHKCFIKGDGKFASIAAASILAKTYRDDYMEKIHKEYPKYHWHQNKGYPTPFHKSTISNFGISPYHRKSFNLNEQLKMDLNK
jgi:ribonuclease HII